MALVFDIHTDDLDTILVDSNESLSKNECHWTGFCPSCGITSILEDIWILDRYNGQLAWICSECVI